MKKPNISIQVEDSRTADLPALRVCFLQEDSQKERYLHSRYDPMREARAWADAVYAKGRSVYVVYGGGLLYHLEALLKKDSSVRVVLVEPIAELESRQREKINARQLPISVIYAPDVLGLRRYIAASLADTEFPVMREALYPPYQGLDLAAEQAFWETLRKARADLIMGLNTMEKFSLEHPRNLLLNLPALRAAGSINEYKEACRGRTAVLVSAGPSLEKNIDLLRGMEDRVVIITGGRTLQTLLRRGIRPHFAVAIDPGLANYRLFEPVLDATVPLVGISTLHPRILQEYQGPFIALGGNYLPAFTKDYLGREDDGLSGAGTVATFQFSLAVYLGCQTLILIGQDLAFSANKKHAESATYGEAGQDNEVDPAAAGYFAVPGNTEPFVYTDHVFNFFRGWFEEAVCQLPGKTFINATEGGAQIEGMQAMPLRQALQTYACTLDAAPLIQKKPLPQAARVTDRQLCERLENLLQDIGKVIGLCEEGVKHSKRLTFNRAKNVSVLKKLDDIDARLDPLLERTEIASLLCQKALFQFQTYVAQNDKDNIENTRQLYRKLLETYQKIQELVEEAIEPFRAQS